MASQQSYTVDVTIGGTRYRLASDDDYARSFGGEFDPRTTALLDTFLSPDAVVLDVGANIGCTAILFGARARRVLAFEPSPTTFRYLRTNVEAARLHNVELMNYGLGADNKTSELTFAATNRAGGFVSEKTKTSAGHVTETIEIRRLDDVTRELALKTIDFVKIDVEGFETHVLEGGRETIAHCRPVVMLELNHWCLNALHRICVPDYLDYLCAYFPIVFAVDGNTYLDVRDPGERYTVMYHHLTQFRYVDLVAAYTEQALDPFRRRYRHGT